MYIHCTATFGQHKFLCTLLFCRQKGKQTSTKTNNQKSLINSTEVNK